MRASKFSLRSLLKATALLTAITAPACGARVNEPAESNTNWLEGCDSDDDCGGGLACACGVCTESCESTSCPGSLTCVPAASCEADHPVCQAQCETDDDCTYLASSATCESGVCSAGKNGLSVSAVQTPAPGSDSGAAAACNGPGHYEVGKEGGYKPCCEGLTEVFQLSRAEDQDGNAVCVDPMIRVSACVAGSCGDGVCEVGENVPCGCAEDCPAAAVGSSSDAGSTPPDAGSSPSTDGGAIALNGQVLPCSNLPAALRDTPIDPNESAIKGSELTVSVSYGGGCETHDFALCYEAPVGPFDTLPLRVVHDPHGDTCEAYLTSELQFDLTPLQAVASVNGENKITLTSFGPYIYGDLTCEDRERDASELMSFVSGTVDLSCETDDDCTITYVGADCYAGCGQVITASGLAQLEAMQAQLNAELCADYAATCGAPLALPCAPFNVGCVEGVCSIEQ